MSTAQQKSQDAAFEQAFACSPHHQLAAVRLKALLSSLGDTHALHQLHAALKQQLPHLAPHVHSTHVATALACGQLDAAPPGARRGSSAQSVLLSVSSAAVGMPGLPFWFERIDWRGNGGSTLLATTYAEKKQ